MNCVIMSNEQHNLINYRKSHISWLFEVNEKIDKKNLLMVGAVLCNGRHTLYGAVLEQFSEEITLK